MLLHGGTSINQYSTANIVIHAVFLLNGLRHALTKKASVSSFIVLRIASHALTAFNSSERSGCVVESQLLSRST